MNRLFTRVILDSVTQTSAEVAWAKTAQTETGDVIRVKFEEANPDPKERALQAECHVIRYLLLEQQVFGEAQGTTGIQLNVSTGQVKKLLQARSKTYHHIKHCAIFLNRSVPQAVIKVTQNKHLQVAGREVQEIQEFKHSHLYEKTKIGMVTITQHAQQRMTQRHQAMNMGTPKNSYKLILALLNNPNLERIEMDKKVKFHKKRKYGENDNAEIWKSHDSPFFITVTRHGNDGTSGAVVTVFTRDMSHQTPNTSTMCYATKRSVQG